MLCFYLGRLWIWQSEILGAIIDLLAWHHHRKDPLFPTHAVPGRKHGSNSEYITAEGKDVEAKHKRDSR